MIFTTKDGTQIEYNKTVGKGDRWVVLATGIVGDMKYYWTHLLPYLHEYNVLVFNNRFAGSSFTEDENGSIELMAKDTYELLDHLKIQKASMFGHSMGAAITMMLCKEHPNLLDKIILANPFAKLSHRGCLLFEAICKMLETQLSWKDIFFVLLPWIYGYNFVVDDIKVASSINFFEKRSLSKFNFARQYKAIKKFDATPWLNQIKTKTLVISSDKDIITTVGDSQLICRQLQNPSLEILTGGHNSLIENPEKLGKLTLQFLR